MITATKICVEVATKEDIPELGRLWLKFVHEIQPNETPKIEWWLKDQIRLFGMPDYRMIVSRDENRLIGFIDFVVFDDPITGKRIGMCRNIYVENRNRNCSVGYCLIRNALRISKGMGSVITDFMCSVKDLKDWERRGYSKVVMMMRR